MWVMVAGMVIVAVGRRYAEETRKNGEIKR